MFALGKLLETSENLGIRELSSRPRAGTGCRARRVREGDEAVEGRSWAVGVGMLSNWGGAAGSSAGKGLGACGVRTM